MYYRPNVLTRQKSRAGRQISKKDLAASLFGTYEYTGQYYWIVFFDSWPNKFGQVQNNLDLSKTTGPIQNNLDLSKIVLDF